MLKNASDVYSGYNYFKHLTLYFLYFACISTLTTLLNFYFNNHLLKLYLHFSVKKDMLTEKKTEITKHHFSSGSY